ncbi:MAG: LacI family DNA-binding transcriptional regulator [Prolixibacteraceae bacterium]|nr:LacI family DNA-binding transcriptional regulator [Prolixibacteraceae bacterium]
MGKRISLKDIAEKVGVSTALVSYVLNGKEKEKRVGKDVVKKIREVAAELNYRPNQIARSLRQGWTKTIGLIVADIANPFFGTMVRVIEDEANKFGYNVLFGSSDEDSEKLGALIDTLCNRQVDGFIIVPPEGSDAAIKRLSEREIPIVLIDRKMKGQNIDSVLIDNYTATYEATNYLLDKGYKRIAIVANKSSLNPMSERIGGYCEAMKEEGLEKEIHIELIKYEHTRADMAESLDKLLLKESKIEALIFTTNSLSISGLYYFRNSELKVPEDVAFIGFDGDEAFDFFYSPITYIVQPVEEMGKESVRLLIDQLNGSRKTVQIRLKHSFIEQQSC